jgi:hypothetical protein
VRVFAVIKHVEDVITGRPNLEILHKHVVHVLSKTRIEFEKVLALLLEAVNDLPVCSVNL